MNSLNRYLQRCSTPIFILLTGSVAMMTYISMYAFRKPFTAATFENVAGWDWSLDFKTAILIAQVLGYAVSKFIGIKVISEITAQKRVTCFIGLVVWAQIMLVLFAILPPSLKIIALFANGLPLGLVWGLVFSYLEGRRVTEALGAILCTSLIFGSGVVQTIGRWLLVDVGISEMWMPAVCGALFLPLAIICIALLAQTPPPTAEDIAQRQERRPMNRAQRQAFYVAFGWGLTALIFTYMLLTAFRVFTDNFAAELWIELGYGNAPEIFITTSIPIALLVLAIMWMSMWVTHNVRALCLLHGVVFAGFALSVIATLLFHFEIINGLWWMLLLNAGLYMSYIPFNCILFDRLVAASGSIANAGFLIYVADAFGYIGTIVILLFKNFIQPQLQWVDFVTAGSYSFGLLGMLLMALSLIYFKKRLRADSSSMKVYYEAI
jgi:MFS family permease